MHSIIKLSILSFVVLSVSIESQSQLIPDNIFGSYYNLSRGVLNENLPENRHDRYRLFNKIHVLEHPQANWDCTLLVGLDYSRCEFLVLHQEGFDESPSKVFIFGSRGHGAGELANPTDFCVTGRYYGEELSYAAIYNIYIADPGNGRILKYHLNSHFVFDKSESIVLDSSDLIPDINVVPASISVFGTEYNNADIIDLVVHDISSNAIVIISENGIEQARLNPYQLGEVGNFKINRIQAWNPNDGHKYLAVAGHGDNGSKVIIIKFLQGNYNSPSIILSQPSQPILDMCYGPALGLFMLHDGTYTTYTNYGTISNGVLAGGYVAVDAVREHLYASSKFNTDFIGGIYRYRAYIGTYVNLDNNIYYNDIEPISFEYAINQQGNYRVRATVYWGQAEYSYILNINNFEIGTHQGVWSTQSNWGTAGSAHVVVSLQRMFNDRVIATYSSEEASLITGPKIRIVSPLEQSRHLSYVDIAVDCEYPQSLSNLAVKLLDEIHGEVFQIIELPNVIAGSHIIRLTFPPFPEDFPCDTLRPFSVVASAVSSSGVINEDFLWTIYRSSKPCESFDDPVPEQGRVGAFFEYSRNTVIKIYDVMGRNVKTFIQNNSESTASVNTLPAGVYFVRGTTANGIICKKIIVVK